MRILPILIGAALAYGNSRKLDRLSLGTLISLINCGLVEHLTHFTKRWFESMFKLGVQVGGVVKFFRVVKYTKWKSLFSVTLWITYTCFPQYKINDMPFKVSGLIVANEWTNGPDQAECKPGYQPVLATKLRIS